MKFCKKLADGIRSHAVGHRREARQIYTHFRSLINVWQYAQALFYLTCYRRKTGPFQPLNELLDKVHMMFSPTRCGFRQCKYGLLDRKRTAKFLWHIVNFSGSLRKLQKEKSWDYVIIILKPHFGRCHILDILYNNE